MAGVQLQLLWGALDLRLRQLLDLSPCDGESARVVGWTHTALFSVVAVVHDQVGALAAAAGLVASVSAGVFQRTHLVFFLLMIALVRKTGLMNMAVASGRGVRVFAWTAVVVAVVVALSNYRGGDGGAVKLWTGGSADHW